MQHHERIYQILVQQNEITWQSIIQELVKSGEIDAWDIDISLLAQKYLVTIQKLHETNFFLSGKVILASALLLRLKSDKFMLEEMTSFESKLFPPEEEEFFEEEYVSGKKRIILEEHPRLTIKTPQARKKKVTIADLIGALEKALDVNERKILRKARWDEISEHLVIPEKPIDISELIEIVLAQIKQLFTKKEQLTFSELVPSEERKDKLNTFVPLLYLANRSQIDLDQQEPFGEIYIHLKKKENSAEHNT